VTAEGKEEGMAGGTSREGDLAQRVLNLLREVQKLPGILFVMGKGPRAVMEGWLDPERARVSLDHGDWLGVENGPWHCHLHLGEVKEIRFVEQADVHDPTHQSFSIRFLNVGAEPVLMIFFDGMYDPAGTLLPDRLAHFRTLQARFSP